ncbi:putative 2OG-Fe(II) oxygenase [Kangiella sp. HZ709]|uniref:putative 2OG-Fe(II) oxygenase n=1 Tax=Kangiella sp. HZ709 TaxID=2666328 RepID=UPI0012B07B0B|nr:putative 2OG-Fe(II) oxygenase [Kangiella sp. HZ709]MRX26982.1 hypothetical protein [Kangiella sp. HZ709]
MNSNKIAISRGGILHTDIWWSQIPASVKLNQDLLTEIQQYKQSNPKRDPLANPGCWRGSDSFSGWPVILENAIGMIKSIHQHYIHTGAPCTNIMNYPADRFESEFWANVNQPDSTNAIHSHSKWHWSGVYYIQGKGTGDIAFYSSQYLNQQTSIGLPFGQSFSISPEDGMLLIFPSYLYHEVLKNTSSAERINIAFNIKINF